MIETFTEAEQEELINEFLSNCKEGQEQEEIINTILNENHSEDE